MKINSINCALRYLLCVMALISISACDGGLFGTGDGTPIIDASTDNLGVSTGESSTSGTSTSVDGSTTSDGNSNGTTGGTTGTTTGDMMSGGSSTAPTFGTDVVFANNSVTLSDQQRLVDIINTSSSTINISYTEAASDTPNIDNLAKLFGSTGVASGKASNYVAINSQQSGYYIFNNSNNDIIGSFGPADLDPNTTTTLWVSDTNLDVTQSSSAVEITALVSSVQTSDPSLAKIRIIYAAPADTTITEGTMGLLSSGDNPGGIDITFNSSENERVSAYQEVPAGEYELHVGDVRFSEQVLELAEGGVYSIVLISVSNRMLLIKLDSNLTTQD